MRTVLIPKTGQRVSRIGFGGYRVRVGNPTHEQALGDALKSGVNVIDTSAHFEQGLSEKLIGKVLKESFAKDNIKRENLFLISKAGYLEFTRSHQYSHPATVRVSDKWHFSLSPYFLESEINSSLERLGVKKLDIFMVNNPERMLVAKDKVYLPSQLYKDLGAAFKFLDSEVKRGRIGGYGICSNTFALPPTSHNHIDLPTILSSLDNPDNFHAVQGPYNLFERDLAQPEVIAMLKRHNVFVMANRPLNAIAEGKVKVLRNKKDLVDDPHPVMSNISKGFEDLAVLENDILDSDLPLPTNKFFWSQILSENFARLSQNHAAAQFYITHKVLPAIENDLGEIRQAAENLEADEEGKAHVLEWANRYKKASTHLLDNIIHYAELDALQSNQHLDNVLRALCPTLSHFTRSVPTIAKPNIHSPLSVSALRISLSTPGIDCVLTGMRSPEYVRDALLAAEAQEISNADLARIFECPLLE
ncbi:uncharacterized protein VTP21DRAFT_772 [Calcarisporiella thermophila]|uniref:uncharacterized protein n=1 Tax=Calcarisporiella thermophila TaxID=911321 RepID=UPI0037422CF8